MKFVTVFLVLLALTATTFAAPLTNSQYEALFTRFVQQYGKSYKGLTLVTKYNTFVDNLNKIIEHNMSGSSYTLGMNQFGDLTQEEFATHIAGLNKKPAYVRAADNKHILDENITAPSSIDWREKDVVNPIMNQGPCGSCWAFSAISPLESRYAIANNKLFKLSEQQLVDCATSAGNSGCNGGLVDIAYDYLAKNGGSCTAEDYPYTGRDDQCKKTCQPVVKIAGYEWLDRLNENSLIKAVAEGPISISVYAGNTAFQFYSGGILDNKSCYGELDHGVAIIGYGTDNGKDYWIVRNSWGNNWGENGYIRIVRMKDMCNLSQEPLIPKLA